MRKRTKVIYSYYFCLAALGSAALALWLSAAYHECYSSYSETQGNDIRQYAGHLVSGVIGMLKCGVVAIDHNEGFVVGFFTMALVWSTVKLWLETKRLAEGAEDQRGDIERSIKESARAATAMDKLATNAVASTELGKERSAQQMRAYLSVSAGGAYYQDWANGVYFGGSPDLINTGNTPAYRVTYTAQAGVYKTPLSSDFKFDLDAPTTIHSMTLGPRQTVNFVGFAKEFVPDTEVESIMKLSGDRGLYCWGRITYDDAFDVHHTTRFCHLIRWIPPESGDITKGRVSVIYIDRHNDAD